ncbi:MAG: hypothetical protein BGN92_11975 [Sphingobacteriales bacterium 41-5]|nr:MAG: hypothetical protein BGN92_11975 [Sphingobacteriales bacterium 41-5]
MITIPQIKSVVSEFLKDKPVKAVYLFGSYARGEADENSDIDLLVDYDNSTTRVSFFDVIRLKIGLEEKLNRKVELVEERLMYHKFKQFIEDDKVKIYEA